MFNKPVSSFFIDGRVGTNKMRYVSNVNTNFVQIRRDLPAVQCIVDIGTSRRINTADIQMPQIGTTLDIFVANGPRQRRQTGQYRFRETVMGNVMLQ